MTVEVKISELPVAVSATATDELEANQAGFSRSITIGQVGAAISGTYGPGIPAFLATPTSANLRTALTDETGTGAAVFANAPALVNPNVGTQLPGDSSTKAASTAFVGAAIGAIPPVDLSGYLPKNNPAATEQFTLATAANAQPIVISGYNITGSNVQSALGITGTLNTTGGVDVISFTITDTAHGSGSSFIRLKGGPAANINQFVVDMTGDMACGGSIQAFNSSAPPAGGNAAFGMWLGNFSGGNLGVMFGSGAPSGLSTFGKYGSIYLNAASPGIPYYNNNGTTSWDRLVGETATQTLTNKTLTNPVVGTQAPGDNTTLAASTAFVAAAIAAGTTAGVASWGGGTTGLLPSAATTGAITLSGTLAVANGGTGVTTSTGTGSNVLSVSPALTGTPTVPTAVSGTSTTQAASTGFVTASGWRILSRQTPSGVGFVELQNIPSDVNELEVHFDLLPVTNDVALLLQMYDGSGVLDTTTGHYAWSNVANTSAQALNAAPYTSGNVSAAISTGILLNFQSSAAGQFIGNGAALGGIQGTFSMPNIRNASRMKTIANAFTFYNSGATQLYSGTGGGWRNVASAITGLRLSFSSGNIASGSFEVWGSP